MKAERDHRGKEKPGGERREGTEEAGTWGRMDDDEETTSSTTCGLESTVSHALRTDWADCFVGFDVREEPSLTSSVKTICIICGGHGAQFDIACEDDLYHLVWAWC